MSEWAKTLPKTPGWYWVRRIGGGNMEICTVIDEWRGYYDGDYIDISQLCDCEWWTTPITPPGTEVTKRVVKGHRPAVYAVLHLCIGEFNIVHDITEAQFKTARDPKQLLTLISAECISKCVDAALSKNSTL